MNSCSQTLTAVLYMYLFYFFIFILISWGWWCVSPRNVGVVRRIRPSHRTHTPMHHGIGEGFFPSPLGGVDVNITLWVKWCLTLKLPVAPKLRVALAIWLVRTIDEQRWGGLEGCWIGDRVAEGDLTGPWRLASL